MKIAIVVKTYTQHRNIGNIYYGYRTCAEHLDGSSSVVNSAKGKIFELLKDDDVRLGIIKADIYDADKISLTENSFDSKGANPITTLWFLRDKTGSIACVEFDNISNGIADLYSAFNLSGTVPSCDPNEEYTKSTELYIINEEEEDSSTENMNSATLSNLDPNPIKE